VESATIRVELEKSAHVSVKVFDVTGKLVSSLLNESRPSGSLEVKVALSRKGIYLAEVVVGAERQILKLVAH
jgi:hypothetical protein